MPARARIPPLHGPAASTTSPALQPHRLAGAHVRRAYAADLPAVAEEFLHPVEIPHVRARGPGRPGERRAQRRSLADGVADEVGAAHGRRQERLAPQGLVDRDLARGDARGPDAVLPPFDVVGDRRRRTGRRCRPWRAPPRARCARAPRSRARTGTPRRGPIRRSARPSARGRGSGRLVPEARSPCSRRVTLTPRSARSHATPQPVTPPPTTMTSLGGCWTVPDTPSL